MIPLNCKCGHPSDRHAAGSTGWHWGACDVDDCACERLFENVSLRFVVGGGGKMSFTGEPEDVWSISLIVDEMFQWRIGGAVSQGAACRMCDALAVSTCYLESSPALQQGRMVSFVRGVEADLGKPNYTSPAFSERDMKAGDSGAG